MPAGRLGAGQGRDGEAAEGVVHVVAGRPCRTSRGAGRDSRCGQFFELALKPVSAEGAKATPKRGQRGPGDGDPFGGHVRLLFQVGRHVEINPNLEARNSKQIQGLKLEIQRKRLAAYGLRFGSFVAFSKFGFRISSFAAYAFSAELTPQAPF